MSIYMGGWVVGGSRLGGDGAYVGFGDGGGEGESEGEEREGGSWWAWVSGIYEE
jgi:hypothetical protein